VVLPYIYILILGTAMAKFEVERRYCAVGVRYSSNIMLLPKRALLIAHVTYIQYSVKAVGTST
jgi:hypothetical protein